VGSALNQVLFIAGGGGAAALAARASAVRRGAAPVSAVTCPKCFESVTLIQPQHKGGAFKGPARGKCLKCMDEQEYDLRVPVNRKATLKAVIPKAETLT